MLDVVGVVAFDGMTEAVIFFAGVAVLVAACIRYTVLAVRDDPLRSLIVARRGLIGWMAAESRGGRRRRARQRSAAAEQGEAEMHYEAPRFWE
jgi:hypothetical protein